MIGPIHENCVPPCTLNAQFYMHEMLGSISGLGMRLKPDMFIHHVATMVRKGFQGKKPQSRLSEI